MVAPRAQDASEVVDPRMKPTCCWVFSKPGEFPVNYCGKPVPYTMVRDDDDRSVRKYQSFCDEHQKAADAQDADAD